MGLHCSGGGVSPRTWKLWSGVAQRGGGRRGGVAGEEGEEEAEEGERRRRSGTAAREAEAAYQAVSCGDKQRPEVVGVHAACLLLLRTQGQQRRPGPEQTRGAAPCAQRENRTVAGAEETEAAPRDQVRGKVSRQTQVGRRQESR